LSLRAEEDDRSGDNHQGQKTFSPNDHSPDQTDEAAIGFVLSLEAAEIRT
jgi:hypothetical protein